LIETEKVQVIYTVHFQHLLLRNS